jgi:hypothetical protein
LKPVTVLRWRDRWLWDTSYVVAFTLAPVVISATLIPLLLPLVGKRAFFIMLLEVVGLLFAAVYGLVGHRVRRLKATLPKSDAEIAEALIFRRPLTSPGVTVLHASRLELFRVIGEPIIVPIADIASISEARWFNGRRLLWKRCFELDLNNGQRVNVAVPEPFGRRWRASLSHGNLPEIPQDLP